MHADDDNDVNEDENDGNHENTSQGFHLLVLVALSSVFYRPAR